MASAESRKSWVAKRFRRLHRLPPVRQRQGRRGTGIETRFINGLDPDPKTRAISANLPHIHRPETLAEWIAAESLDEWVKRLHAEGTGVHTAADDTRPASFRARLETPASTTRTIVLAFN